MSTARLVDEAYVKTGQLKVAGKPVAMLGPDSRRAAEAALCALDQGAFWGYYDLLFAARYSQRPEAYSSDSLKGLASQLGLDGALFATCLEGGTYAQRVLDETQAAARRGVTGVPAFFVNDTRIEGARPFEVFKAAIDAQLR